MLRPRACFTQCHVCTSGQQQLLRKGQWTEHADSNFLSGYTQTSILLQPAACVPRTNSFGFSNPNSVPSEGITFFTAPALHCCNAQAGSDPHGAEQAPLSPRWEGGNCVQAFTFTWEMPYFWYCGRNSQFECSMGQKLQVIRE